MMRLTATSPAQGLTPLRHGAAELAELQGGPAFRIAPFDLPQVEAALAPLGLRYPAAGRVVTGSGGAILWYGPAEALLLAPACPDFRAAAAVTAYGDALCHLRLSGAAAVDVLARLMPIDLRAPMFGADHTALTLLGKQRVSIRRAGAEGFDLLTARSMAGSAVAEIARAMQLVAAR